MFNKIYIIIHHEEITKKQSFHSSKLKEKSCNNTDKQLVISTAVLDIDLINDFCSTYFERFKNMNYLKKNWYRKASLLIVNEIFQFDKTDQHQTL